MLEDIKKLDIILKVDYNESYILALIQIIFVDSFVYKESLKESL